VVGLTVVVVVVLYVSIALFAIVMVKGWKKKTIVLVIFILIPTADVIAGRIYFKYLCNTRSGQFMYKTVEVEEEYLYQPGELMKHKLDETGNQFAIAEGGEINREKLRQRYDFRFIKRDRNYSKYLPIEKLRSYIEDSEKKELLSEAISYTYNGGWVERLYQPSTIHCTDDRPSIHATLFDRTLIVN